jgi:hypothetical protein
MDEYSCGKYAGRRMVLEAHRDCDPVGRTGILKRGSRERQELGGGENWHMLLYGGKPPVSWGISVQI